MNITLLFNKRLRKNYNEVLKLETAEEIKKFLSAISKTERDELFAYTYGYAILERRRMGITISEYFLLHYDEFIPDVKKNEFDKVDRHLNIIFTIAAVVIAVILLI